MPSLLWKEWREQSWKLGFGCVVLGALALIGLRTRMVADANMMMAVCALGLALLPVLASTGLVPSERSEGCFESLLALPVAPWKILLAKTIVGALLCAGPLAAAAAVSVLAVGGREMLSADIVILHARSIFTALSLFVWMMALTIRLPNETRAGLLALGVLIIWLMVQLGAVGTSTPMIPVLTLAVVPFSFVSFSDHAPRLAILLVVQSLIALALWFWTSRRLSAFSEGDQ